MRRIFLSLCLLLIFCGRASAALPAVCNTVSTDNFTRANENPLSDHAYWTTQTGSTALQVAGNVAETTSTASASRALWLQTWYPNDQCSVITISAIAATTQLGPNVRMAPGANTSYQFSVSPTTYAISKLVAGSGTTLKSGVGTFAANDVLAIAAVGTTITIYKNGTAVDSATDSAITQGAPGFVIFDSASVVNGKISLWTAGGSFTGVWTKLGPIIPPNATDTVGPLAGTSNGALLYEGNAQILSGTVFKMWFMGRNDIFYAESYDAIHWTRRATALLTSVGLQEVYKDSGTYYLYGSATPTCTTCVVSSYTSSDGITWTLQVATALGHGTAGNFDDASVQYLRPFLKVGATWFASYTGLHAGAVKQGIATSTDLLNWTNAATGTTQGGFNVAMSSTNFYAWGGFTDFYGGTSIARYHSTDSGATWDAGFESYQRSLFMEGFTLSTGAIVPVQLIEANGNVYAFYTGTRAEDGGLGYTMMAAVATGQTLATLVGTNEGIIFPQTDPQLANFCTNPVASDNFTRANETPLGNGNWTTAFTPNVQINLVSNNAQATSTTQLSHSIWTGRAWSPNQCSQQTLSGFNAAGTSAAGLSVRASTAASTFYEFAVTGLTYATSKAIAGSGTTIRASQHSNPFGLGDTIILNISGSTLTAYKQGGGITTMIEQVSDASITTGRPGFILFDNTTAATSKSSLWQGGQGSNGSGVSAIVVP